MAQPTTKYFGSLSLDGIKQAVKQVPTKVDSHEKYGNQIKVTAARWEDGGISLEVWDNEAKESIKLGRLLVSQFEDGAKVADKVSDDLPF